MLERDVTVAAKADEAGEREAAVDGAEAASEEPSLAREPSGPLAGEGGEGTILLWRTSRIRLVDIQII